MTSDGGMLLLREVDRIRRLTDRFASCFVDARDVSRTEHSVLDLVRQRVYAWALGYEDLNDHETLRADELLAECVGKTEPARTAPPARERSRPLLAGKSTLNRFEWSLGAVADEDRYHRIALDADAAEQFFIDIFLVRPRSVC